VCLIQEKRKSELEALKSTRVSALATQAADCEMYKLQADNDRANIEQLKKALNLYQQREVRCRKVSAADFCKVNVIHSGPH